MFKAQPLSWIVIHIVVISLPIQLRVGFEHICLVIIEMTTWGKNSGQKSAHVVDLIDIGAWKCQPFSFPTQYVDFSFRVIFCIWV